MIRRHTKGEKEIHFEPALTVVSGNYVTAKRRGVIDGTDYGLTGEVGVGDSMWSHCAICSIPSLTKALRRSAL